MDFQFEFSFDRLSGSLVLPAYYFLVLVWTLSRSCGSTFIETRRGSVRFHLITFFALKIKVNFAMDAKPTVKWLQKGGFLEKRLHLDEFHSTFSK